MKKLYVVQLSTEERRDLLAFIRAGAAGAGSLRRARPPLLPDEGRTADEIGSALHGGKATVARTRQSFATEGLQAALGERPRPGGERKRSDKQEAHLIALACTSPPEGRERWTLRLLAGRMVELGVVDSLSYETVRRTLKKTA